MASKFVVPVIEGETDISNCITLQQAAVRLKITYSRVRQLVILGKFPGAFKTKIPGFSMPAVFLPLSDIEEYERTRKNRGGYSKSGIERYKGRQYIVYIPWLLEEKYKKIFAADGIEMKPRWQYQKERQAQYRAGLDPTQEQDDECDD